MEGLHHTLPFRLGDQCQKGGRKFLKLEVISGSWQSSWQNRAGAHRIQNLTSYTNSSQTKSQQREGEVGMDSQPSPQSYLQLIPAGREKISFSQRSDTGYINHTQVGPMLRSSWLTQNGLHWFLLFLFSVVGGIFLFVFCCLFLGGVFILFSGVVGFFILFCLGRVKTWSWVGSEVGRIWEKNLERGKNMIKNMKKI